MAQISYGTITITDTNDVESIVVEYNRNQSTTTPPAQTDSGWSTKRPTWAQDYYIWQRTRTHKSGTQASEDTLGNAVCITGSTGQSGAPGKGITGIETLYATNNSTTTAPTSASEWQPQPPTYNSSKPKYWVKVTTTYSVGDPTVVTYLDNGITDAMATAAAANSSATEALSKTQAKYATSSTEATTPAKVAVFNPAVTTWSLFNGAEIFVKFTKKNDVANPTLSVKPSSSGSGTAAKTIRDSDGNALDSKFYWGANSLVHFVYDGTYWRILDIVTTAKYNNMVSDISGMSSTIGAHTTRLNGLDELTTTHETKITQTANSITSLVSNEETYTKPDGTTGTNTIHSAIKQNADNINLKVDKNGVIAAINLSTETSGGSTAKISADKVNIEGAAIFSSYATKTDAQGYATTAKNEAIAEIPTNVSELNNDSGYQTSSQVNTAITSKGYQTASDVSTAITKAVGGFTILWDSNAGTTYAGGEAKICKLDPETGTVTQAAGWAMWNGVKRTVPNVEYNPNSALPYNIPVYLVLRLSSATSTTGTVYPVWYASGWKYNTKLSAPAAADTADWTWVEATDMVLGKCVETASEAVFTECETYNPPRSFKAISSVTTTAASAQATANAAAPKTLAVSEEQYIYISKVSGTLSVPVNNTWVTETGYTPDTWTTKRPAYDSSYPVLFVAKQKKVVSGAVTCTTPLKDDTTTIIDGGHITTGTIDASKVTVTNINASNIKAGTLSVGRLPDDALNSNIEIGGRNLLCGTGTSVSKATTATTSYVVQSLYYTPNKVTLASLGFVANDEITLSFDWEVTSATTYGNARIEWYGYKDSSSTDTYLAVLINPFATFSSSNTSGHVSITVKLTSTTINSKRLVVRIDNSALTLTISNLKLEKGNKATDWSPAPEDVDGSINKAKELANNALGNAATAQGTANNALKNATIADGKAVSAQSTANEANEKANNALEKYGTMSSIVNDYNNLRNYYLEFNPTPSGISGLIIGARNSDDSDNAFKTEITNRELAFRQGTDKVAWINTNEFFINHGAIQIGLRVGNFVIFDEDGALNIKYEPRSTNE